MSILKLDSKKRQTQKHLYLEVQSRSQDEHNQHTPLELCEEIVEKLVESDADFSGNILIISTVEFIPVILRVLADKGLSKDKIWFSSWNEYKRNFAENLGINILGHLLDQEIDMKFDVIVGNPPYKRELHLDILSKSFDLLKEKTGQLVFIHPAIWLYVQKPGRTLKSALEIKEKIGNKFKSFKFINGNKLFNIRLFGPCSITHIDMSKLNPEVNVINEMNNTNISYTNSKEINPFFDNYKIFNSLKEKIWTYCESVNNIQNNLDKAEGNFFVNLENIIGDSNKDLDSVCVANCFYDFIYTTNRNITENPVKTQGGQKQFISFYNKEQAENCLNYLTTIKFSKFCLMIIKVGQHLSSGRPLRFVPFFDFSTKWTDEDCFKELNLTTEEIDFIKKHVNSFYSNYAHDPKFNV